MDSLGRSLIVLGLVLLAAGGVCLLCLRLGVPLGRLPGDIAYRGRNVRMYFPLATSIFLSIAVSLLLYLINHFRGR